MLEVSDMCKSPKQMHKLIFLGGSNEKSHFFYQAADKNYTAFGKKSSEPTYRQYLSIRIPSDMFVR